MQRIRRAVRGAICLCAALCLTACGLVRPVSDPEVVHVTRTVYLPVPAALTAPTPVPDAPTPLCAESVVPVLCTGQIDDWRVEVSDALGRCNADKAAIAQLEPPQ